MSQWRLMPFLVPQGNCRRGGVRNAQCDKFTSNTLRKKVPGHNLQRICEAETTQAIATLSATGHMYRVQATKWQIITRIVPQRDNRDSDRVRPEIHTLRTRNHQIKLQPPSPSGSQKQNTGCLQRHMRSKTIARSNREEPGRDHFNHEQATKPERQASRDICTVRSRSITTSSSATKRSGH